MPTPQHKKAWVTTPNEFYTPTGVLQVDQILTDYMDPNTALLTEGVVVISKKALKDQSTHHGVDYTSIETHQSAFRSWLKATAAPAGGNLSAEEQKAYWDKFSGKTISVFMFQPSKGYAIKALAHRDALGSTALPWYKLYTRVWMVTGLRVLGKGPKINEGFIERASGEAAIEGDGSAANIPVTGGAGAGHADQRAKSHTIEDSDPFVYAYRLH
jgi:hypothetical protein